MNEQAKKRKQLKKELTEGKYSNMPASVRAVALKAISNKEKAK